MDLHFCRMAFWDSRTVLKVKFACFQKIGIVHFGVAVSWLEAMRLYFFPDRIKSVEIHQLPL